MREDETKARAFARTLRRQMTNAEIILWSRLRRNACQGHKFRRQHPIGPYVADFACIAARLVVEVDGATHGTEEERDHDARRDAFMASKGWRIVRVQNHEVYKRLDDVLAAICHWIPLSEPTKKDRGRSSLSRR
jgi:very-short-patch-repair endonuclease